MEVPDKLKAEAPRDLAICPLDLYHKDVNQPPQRHVQCSVHVRAVVNYIAFHVGFIFA